MMKCPCCGAQGHCFCSFHTIQKGVVPPCGGCMKHQVQSIERKTPQPGGGVLVENVIEHVCKK